MTPRKTGEVVGFWGADSPFYVQLVRRIRLTVGLLVFLWAVPVVQFWFPRRPDGRKVVRFWLGFGLSVLVVE